MLYFYCIEGRTKINKNAGIGPLKIEINNDGTVPNVSLNQPDYRWPKMTATN